MTNKQKALAAITACVLFWGFSFISIKIAVAVFPPMTLGALRFALALAFLFFIKKKMAPAEKIAKKDIPMLAGAGLTGVTLYFFFENNGVSLIPASEASIIIGAIPVLTLIAGGIGTKITMYKKRGPVTAERETGENISGGSSIFRRVILPGAGALISLTGVALVAGVSFALRGAVTGYMFMAGACVSWVTYSFLTRRLFSGHSRIFIVFWQSLAGFIGFLPFACIDFLNSSWQMPGLPVWGHVVFLGICCSAMGYWFYALALEVLGVSTSSLFINFIPVVSAIGGYFILGERLSPLQLFGAALVLAGVYLAMAAPGKTD